MGADAQGARGTDISVIYWGAGGAQACSGLCHSKPFMWCLSRVQWVPAVIPVGAGLRGDPGRVVNGNNGVAVLPGRPEGCWGAGGRELRSWAAAP